MREKKSDGLFKIFLLWAFVLLCRPQDIFPVIALLRPVLLLNIIVLVYFTINYSALPRLQFTKSRQLKLFIALVCVIILSIPFSYYTRRSFEFLIMIYINAILFVFISIKLVSTFEKVRSLIFTFCFGIIIYSALAMLKGTFADGRVVIGQMFDPNDLAFVLVSCWPLNLIYISKGNFLYRRLIALIGVFIEIVVIMLTASRGGFISLIFVFVLLIVRTKYTLKRSHKIMFVCLSLLVLMQFTEVINITRINSITDIGDDYNVSDETGRIKIWKTGIRLMLTHPLTGVGASCFAEAIGRDRAERGLKEIWQAPHNSLIQIGTETGILGLVIFILLSWRAAIIFRNKTNVKNSIEFELKKISEMISIGFYGHLLAGMFLSQAYSIYWAFFIALSIIFENIANKNERKLEFYQYGN